ncbi:MAG: alkaline phosphatase [Sphaerochaetaceae bacterium]|nr:alkaline phosphatase [Sphaerochaetaceae bacterium]
MKRLSFTVISILFAILVLSCMVACKQEQPAQTTFVVTFDTQGGSEIKPVTVVEGAKVSKPSDPTREGYYFGGWYKDASYKNKFKFTAAITADTTAYARWWTTEYYMPAGWEQTIPAWSEPDAETVSVPASVLKGDMTKEVTNVTPELKAALAEAVADPTYFKNPKNIIVIISDGMGISHVQASEKYSGELIMTRLPNVGAADVATRERYEELLKSDITDSAAGGTALSTGYKTTKLFAAMDAEGNELKSVSELAREQGKLVGIVTNAELADATPAVYSIHNKNRSQGWTKMCEQEVVFGADLFMGNGYGDYSSYFNSGNELYPYTSDIKLYKDAAEIVSHFADDSKMWAVFGGTANKFARFDTTSKSYPNLQQMTAYALSWLDYQDSTNNSDKGFVVMIENTYTDHFGHGNTPNDGSANTFGIVKEVQSTDEAVAIALKYVLEHPDTALIVTADHETGNTTLKSGWETDFNRIVASSGNHSDQLVPVFAIGKGTEKLNTLERTEAERAAGAKWDKATTYENAKIGQVVGALLGDDTFGGVVGTDDSSKRSPKFEITTTAVASSLSYTLEMTGAWIQSGNYIQFKVKPVSSSDKITVSVAKDAETPVVSSLSQTVFSSTDSIAKPVMDGYYCKTPLMRAYNQAFIERSEFADGWYQISVPAPAKGNKLVITLESSGSMPIGSKVYMDDLTVQFASTYGFIKFTSDKATATGACLVAE